MEKNFTIKVKSSGLVFDVETNGYNCTLTDKDGNSTNHSRLEVATQINDGKWLKGVR